MHKRNLGFLVLASALFINFLSVHSVAAQVSNLIANPSVETASGAVPASWASNKWGTTAATFTYPTGGAQDGTRYVKTQITTAGTGDAKWYPNPINATASQTFTFSNYYQSNVQSFVEVEYLLTTGAYQYVRLATLPAAAAWTQYQKTFTAPANVKSFTVYHFIQAVGTLSVDNYVLSSGTTPPPPTPFTFSLSNGGNKSLAQGQSITNAITATLSSGTTQAVNFLASGLPSGITASFSQNSCSPTCSSTLTLAANNSAATGTVLVTVSGTSGTTTKTTSFNLTVNAAPVVPPAQPFIFSLSDAGNRTVVQGQSTTTLITATLSNGTAQSVAFSATGLPSGVTASFNAPSCSPTCSTTLTFAASASAALGTFPITVNGVSGTTTKTTSFSLTVTAAPVVPPPPTGNNLILNPSVETASGAVPASWASNKWGTNVATFTYPTGGAQEGTRYVKTQITTAGTGDAKWAPAAVAATPGKTYTLTSYYQSSVQSYLEIEYLLTSGSYQYVRLATLPAAASWTQIQKTFVAPANAKSMTVLHFIQAVGTLSVDNYSLTDGTVTPPPPANFDFSLSNGGAKSVTQGQSVTNAVTATLSSGTTKAVAFSVSGLPSGVTSSFSQNSCSPTCSTTLTLSAGAAAAVGTQTITVTASAGTTTKTTAFALTVNATTPPPVTNLILNPSVETENGTVPANWGTQTWGTNNAIFTYIKNAGHTGTHSAKVDITTYTDGDAKWVHNTLPVTPGDNYRFSNWYKSTVETYVVVDFTNTDDSHYYLGFRASAPSANWKQFTEAFSVPYNAKEMTVYHLLLGVGSLTVDDYSLAKITPQGFSRGIVTLAFDDGWEEDTTTVLPVLRDYGFHATMFFATTFLESTPPTGPINVSGPAAIHAMQADGHEIGGHSVTHPDLTTLSAADLDYELSHSKSYLESVAGAGQVKNLATPYGTYNDAVIAKAKTLYSSLRSTDEGYNSPESFDQYRLMVQNMQKTTTLAEFQSWVNQAKADKSWLVLVYHRVATTNLEDFDTPEANFRPQMEIIKNAGITVLTTEQALQEVLPQMGL